MPSATTTTTTLSTTGNLHQVPTEVIVHPLVLLSVVDHYNRAAQNTKKRVLGVLLGNWQGSTVHVCNSYAVPFEEDEKDPSVWFLDHNYHESMSTLFRKVNAKEVPIGWYHTGPKLRSNDLVINDVFRKYVSHLTPVLVIIDVKPKEAGGLPTDAYFAIEEIHDDGTASTKTFAHLPSHIDAEEAEEIGVEHLLRDIKDNAVGTLSTSITEQLTALHGLDTHLSDIAAYLQRVLSGELPMNHAILAHLQNIFNLAPPNPTQDPQLSRAFATTTHDASLSTYVASLVRAVVSMHHLINNKLENMKAEKVVLPEAAEAEEKKEGVPVAGK